jgi:hypothetical protein
MGLQQLQQKNVSAAAIYTEYSVVIPPSVMNLTIALRPSGTPANIFWYMATTNGSNPGSASNLPTTYNTIPASSGGITKLGKFGGQTIYFQVDQTNQTIEVDYYGDN